MFNLLLSVMGAFERSVIRERQKEKIELAEAKNLYKSRKPSLNLEQIELIKQQIYLGISKTKIARDFGISRKTFYQNIL